MPELSQDKIFKYLTAILGLLSLGLLVREIFFTSGPSDTPEIVFPVAEVDIKTEVFEEFDIEGLTPFQRIAFPELVGRDRPFEPYSIEEYNAALQALYSTSTATGTEPAVTTTEEAATSTENAATTTEEAATTTEE